MKPKVDVDRISNTADWDNAEAIPFENVYVASATTDTAASINTKLEEGLHLVLQPGIYYLEESIKVKNDDVVVLGLGMATLHPVNGTAALEVDGEGVRIAGLLIEAGISASDVLFRIGLDREEGHRLHPTVV